MQAPDKLVLNTCIEIVPSEVQKNINFDDYIYYNKSLTSQNCTNRVPFTNMI